MALSMISSTGDLYLASMNSGWKNISGPKNLSYPTSQVYFYNYRIIFYLLSEWIDSIIFFEFTRLLE